MEQVVAAENMHRAWRQVKANNGAPGIDGMRIEDFPGFAREHWPTIRQPPARWHLSSAPVRRVSIPKPGGGERLLGIPTVLDRLIQQAIAQVLTPIFDPEFSESSFGFRPKRSAHGALRQVQAHIGAGYRIAVDLDLAKFFDNVQHDVLMARVARRIGDARLLGLIGRYLRAGVMVGDTFQPSELGTPQGAPLSPLLANILLDDLDRELEASGHRFARYADDLLILVKSVRAGQRVKTQPHHVPGPAAQAGGQRAQEPGDGDRRMRVPRIHLPSGQAALVGVGLRGLQAPRPGTDRAQLGRLDGVPARQARAVRARLDGLLRHLAVLPSGPRVGPVASPACPHVLLETVAPGAARRCVTFWPWGPPSVQRS